MVSKASMEFRVECDREDGTITVGVRFYDAKSNQFPECRSFYRFIADELRKEGTEYDDVETYFDDNDDWCDRVQFTYIGDTSGFAFYERGELITDKTYEVLKTIGDNVTNLFWRNPDYAINVDNSLAKSDVSGDDDTNFFDLCFAYGVQFFVKSRVGQKPPIGNGLC